MAGVGVYKSRSRHQCGRRGGCSNVWLMILVCHGTNVAGEVFYMLLGISLFEGNMVAPGFESYLVALCFYSVGRCLHWFVSYPVL